MGHNSYENKSKDSEFYRDSMKNNNNYESPEIHSSPGNWDSQEDDEMSNLEIRNQIYNHNTEPIYRTYDNDSTNTSRSSSNSSTSSTDASNTGTYTNSVNNSPKFISRMVNGPPHHVPVPNFGVATCACAAFVKCQPCGLIPDLDFMHKSQLACPCAPKLNCPACPPLSLIHEIAAKKVNYIFK